MWYQFFNVLLLCIAYIHFCECESFGNIHTLKQSVTEKTYNDCANGLCTVEDNAVDERHESKVPVLEYTTGPEHPGHHTREKRQIRETVIKYAERMERDSNFITVRLTDGNNPIYSYTYNRVMVGGQEIKLPLVVRARISRSHIKPSNSRGSSAISSGAKTNCRRMGMYPGDAFGHLIAYKLGGPSEFYNFVPMTQAINIGTVSGAVIAPSVWAATEREVTQFIENENGHVTMTVVLKYDLTAAIFPYRAAFIGQAQTNLAFNGDRREIKDFWYTNDPNAPDPEVH